MVPTRRTASTTTSLRCGSKAVSSSASHRDDLGKSACCGWSTVRLRLHGKCAGSTFSWPWTRPHGLRPAVDHGASRQGDQLQDVAPVLRTGSGAIMTRRAVGQLPNSAFVIVVSAVRSRLWADSPNATLYVPWAMRHFSAGSTSSRIQNVRGKRVDRLGQGKSVEQRQQRRGDMVAGPDERCTGQSGRVGDIRGESVSPPPPRRASSRAIVSRR